MEDKIHKLAAGNVMVMGKSGGGKTCLQSQIMSRSDVTQLQQRYASEGNDLLADALPKKTATSGLP
ncbi:hypothetical protein ACWKX9_22030 [Enterobacter asburiae]